VERRIALQVAGFLPLPFVIAGTDMVALVPEKLARIHTRDDGPVVQVEPPFDEVVLAEGYWFAGDRLSDPAHRWFFARLDELAEELAATDD
jgi:DNA-binding transcriptional LysR family regulator